METAKVRDINGDTFSLDDKDKVISTLNTTGVLVICSRSSISYGTNSLNAAHAIQRGSVLGVSTPECVQSSNVLHPDVGILLFLLNDTYTIGNTSTIIPLLQAQPAEILGLRAFTATHFADQNAARQMFRISLSGERILDLRGGDILVCTKDVRRSIPYITTPAPNLTVVVTETHYYPQSLDVDDLDKKVQPELRQRYLEIAKGELSEVNGKVIWSKEMFNARLPEPQI